jgi:RNA polymerase sigma factor (TIGR02999 family)
MKRRGRAKATLRGNNSPTRAKPKMSKTWNLAAGTVSESHFGEESRSCGSPSESGRASKVQLSVSPMNEVTRILSAIEQGDPSAAVQLIPLVYEELRQLAAQKLAREKPGQTLQATALVHEAYLRVVDTEAAQHWNSRGHFFGAAAQAMRRILVENARRKRRAKHGGGLARLDLGVVDPAAPEACEDLVALDEALGELAIKDPIKARLVELRSFAGLRLDEAATILGISPSTADRHWAYARAWLYRRIRTERGP